MWKISAYCFCSLIAVYRKQNHFDSVPLTFRLKFTQGRILWILRKKNIGIFFSPFSVQIDSWEGLKWHTTMGNWGSRYITNPAGTPDHHKPPSFDPMYGFPNGRKERGTFVLFSIGKGNAFVFVRGYVVKFLRKSSTTDPFTLIEYSFRHKHYSHYIISVHIRQRLQKQNRQSAVSFMKKKKQKMKIHFFSSDDRNWGGNDGRKDPIERQGLLCTQIDRLQTMQTRGLAVGVSVCSWETCLSYLQIWWVSIVSNHPNFFIKLY